MSWQAIGPRRRFVAGAHPADGRLANLPATPGLVNSPAQGNRNDRRSRRPTAPGRHELPPKPLKLYSRRDATSEVEADTYPVVKLPIIRCMIGLAGTLEGELILRQHV